MCGIVGYIGKRKAAPVVLTGLRRLEYRGYDSSGVVTLDPTGFRCEKMAGNLDALFSAVKGTRLDGTVGIGHTRWATHGPPTRENAHPHFSCDDAIAIVHNGIIENFEELRASLQDGGHRFRSETDTEVIAHLLEKHYHGDPFAAIRATVAQLVGSFALAILFRRHPDSLYGVRQNSPLVAGMSTTGALLASDAPAILPLTRNLVFLEEGEIIALTPSGFQLFGFDGRRRARRPKRVSWTFESACKEGFPHFMLKEIHEQPTSIRRTIAGRLDLRSGSVKFNPPVLSAQALRGIQRVSFVACGTAAHAALVGKYYVEEIAKVPAAVFLASEFRYMNPVLDSRSLVVAVSQSGETADTLAAVREANRCGAPTIAVSNVIGSSVPRECAAAIYTHAGPEIGVAATKTYTAQIAVLALFAIHLGRVRGTLGAAEARELLDDLAKVPAKVEQVLKGADRIMQCVERFKNVYNFMYVGRKYNYPTALEGALKLKEISYIHAEGYAAGEMKHGPLALVDSSFPTVAIAVQDSVYAKMRSNIQEIRARKGVIIGIATENDAQMPTAVDYTIFVPECRELFYPMLTIVPLQLLAYHIAVKRGCSVDQPRNLAKSVTVE
ncbi:MAG: glutamine--fructose-6-phosphate transaminase (isomerizing) [Planctomycetota bacterium]|nr:glutamine--fructose-6-phosphate transaminase (isomerizing) [Planctomycetota bacterium]